MDLRHIRAQNGNRTIVRTVAKFNLLRGHCTLLLFLPLFMSLCAPAWIDQRRALLICARHSLDGGIGKKPFSSRHWGQEEASYAANKSRKP